VCIKTHNKLTRCLLAVLDASGKLHLINIIDLAGDTFIRATAAVDGHFNSVSRCGQAGNLLRSSLAVTSLTTQGCTAP